MKTATPPQGAPLVIDRFGSLDRSDDTAPVHPYEIRRALREYNEDRHAPKGLVLAVAACASWALVVGIALLILELIGVSV